MSRINWKTYITTDPDLHHGDPCISGTRIPVATLVGSLADGMTPGEIITMYPQLIFKDLLWILKYPNKI